MKLLQYLGVLAAAMLGGALMNWVMAGHAVSADSPSAKSVETNELVLKNKDGKVRARLSVDTNDMPLLEMFNADGKVRARIGADQDNFGLILGQDDGLKTGEFVSASRGWPRLTMYTTTNLVGFDAYVGLMHESKLSLGSGNTTWNCQVWGEGGCDIGVWDHASDAKGNQTITERWSAEEKDGQFSLLLNNAKGEKVWGQSAK